MRRVSSTLGAGPLPMVKLYVVVCNIYVQQRSRFRQSVADTTVPCTTVVAAASVYGRIGFGAPGAGLDDGDGVRTCVVCNTLADHDSGR